MPFVAEIVIFYITVAQLLPPEAHLFLARSEGRLFLMGWVCLAEYLMYCPL